MNSVSRREFLRTVGAGALASIASNRAGHLPGAPVGSGRRDPRAFRIRTITAGVELRTVDDHDALRAARDFLSSAAGTFGASYEVQTTRIATQPLPRYLPSWLGRSALASLQELDRFAGEAGSMLSLGPVLTEDGDDPGFASWAADLVASTTNTSFSAFVAGPNRGIHGRSARAAAEAISAISRATAGGEGNFRFCATAHCPPGTPFFPAAYHEGPRAFAVGLESPPLLQAALDGLDTRIATAAEAEAAMRSRLEAALAPVEALAERISRETGWRYLGIDTSPAPGPDASIGRVIETLAGAPFGSPSTLSACSSITGVLQGLEARTCGYSGLMLPVLEDTVLAGRATEGRYGVSELLLYSSVCGTGLDVVPLPGDTPVTALAATIVDVAALATRYQKPLSARLFPIPGKGAGEMVEFDNPFLTRCRVMALD